MRRKTIEIPKKEPVKYTRLPFHVGDVIKKKSSFEVISIKGKEDKIRLRDIKTRIKINVRISEIQGYKILTKKEVK